MTVCLCKWGAEEDCEVCQPISIPMRPRRHKGIAPIVLTSDDIKRALREKAHAEEKPWRPGERRK